MEQISTPFEFYLRSVINDTQLESGIHSILESFTRIQLEKNNFFVEKGEVCAHFCYIESGILQHSITVNGDEKTTYLALKNSSTAALKSFKNQIPARKNIRALSNCVLWVINVSTFQNLMVGNKAFKRFYYNLIENQIYLIDDYRIDLLTLSPEDRYRKLLLNEPKLLQEVPLHYLASFLGISSRHMSRIRKNII